VADRPQNYCRDCGNLWFPHRAGAAARCPGCGSLKVGEMLSLDDAAAPAPQRPLPHNRRGSRAESDVATPVGGASALPLLLGLGFVSLAVLTAGGFAAFFLMDNDPPPHPDAEVVAAAPKTPAPAPVRERVAPGPTPIPTPVVSPTPVPMPVPAPPPPAPRPEPILTPLPEPPPPPTPNPQPMPPDVSATTPKPFPRPPHPFPAPPGWVSGWEKAGDVRVRVAGVASTRVPLEKRQKKLLSTETYFVVWVEIENTSRAAHTYRRWQPVLTGECTLRYASNAAIPYAIYPPETGREWFSEFTQPIPPGGPALLESLVFSRPDTNTTGDLSLTLDGSRVGVTGRFAFTIPHAVWTKR
jgi:hypothetical protein